MTPIELNLLLCLYCGIYVTADTDYICGPIADDYTMALRVMLNKAALRSNSELMYVED